MLVGVLGFDLLLVDEHPPERKRVVVKPVKAAPRRCDVSRSPRPLRGPRGRDAEIELLSTRRRMFGDRDDE